MILGGIRRHLAKLGYPAGQLVNFVEGERHAALLGRSQQMQDGVGGAAHGDVHHHGVLERFHGGNAQRQHAGVVILVIAAGILHNLSSGFQEQGFG